MTKPVRIKVGYFCPRGGTSEANGHFELLNDPEYDTACSGKGWDIYMNVDVLDLGMLPEWGLEQVGEAIELGD